jgi:hypothetical protein
MTGWNERDFLEAMMPRLRNTQGPDHCPDVETMCAIADEDMDDSLRVAIAAHTAICPACASLQQRLFRFNDAKDIESGPEWKETERRLEDWFKQFVASDGAQRTQEPLRHWWQNLAGLLGAPPVRWALVAATALVLVIGSFVAGRISVRSPQSAAVFIRPGKSVTNTAVPPTTTEHSRPEPPNSERQIARAAPPRKSRVVGEAPARFGKPPVGLDAGGHTTEPTSTTQTSPETLQNPVVSSTAAIRQEPEQAAAAAAPPSPFAREGTRGETAQTSGRSAPISRPASRAFAVSLGRATPPAASRNLTSAGETRPENQPTPVPTPPVIRLEAGTRVWITLKSVLPRVDGVSEFRGVVLLPVTQSDVVLLGRNTQVSGTMTVRNGKRSVQILEFLSPGAHYRLRSASGEANLRLLGAGEVVEFDAGRVLETWMASASTYEKLPPE